MGRIYLIQECIPHYRIKIFRQLKQHYGKRLVFCASPQNSDGLTTIFADELDIKKTGKIYRLGPFFFQTNLNVFPLAKEDIVLLPGNIRWLNLYWFFLAKIRRKFKIIWWSQLGTQKGFIGLWRRWMMRQADNVLLYTEQEIKQYKKSKKQTVFSINNNVDTEEIANCIALWDDKAIAEFKKETFCENAIVLLFCSKLFKKCKLEILLKIMPQLWEKFSDIRLAVIGEGPELEHYRQLAEKWEVSKQCKWAGAIYDQRILSRYFLASDYFVYPGAIGLSLNHALSYGLWVITSNDFKRHGPEIANLREGENGCFFEKDNPIDLLRVLENTIDEDQKDGKTRKVDQPAENPGLQEMVDGFIRCIESPGTRTK